MPDRIDDRISFDPELEIMETDFSDLTLVDRETVERFYDQIEAKIAATGRDQWYFLVNYRNCRIMPEAWLAHSLRGKRLNLTHSLGTVRYDASEETRAEIERRANTEAFDPNLFTNREDALERIIAMRGKRPAWMTRKRTPSQYSEAEFARRLAFLPDEQIMDVDFSDFSFATNSDVHAFYDYIETRIGASGQPKWYFLVNYRNCDIDLRAWISFSQRGKRLNEWHSLGSVRYGTDTDTEDEIRAQAGRKDFRPNIRATREEALARIAEMKVERG